MDNWSRAPLKFPRPALPCEPPRPTSAIHIQLDISSISSLLSFTVLTVASSLAMSARAGTPPKRRISQPDVSASGNPPKASKMSAAAPVFNPSRPLPPRNSVGGDAESSVKDEENSGDVGATAPAARGESSAAAAATASAMAAAIAASRVTRPLPGSRRMQTGADFVPQQAAVPKSNEAKENTRRLIVVLSQVSAARLEISSDRQCPYRGR